MFEHAMMSLKDWACAKDIGVPAGNPSLASKHASRFESGMTTYSGAAGTDKAAEVSDAGA
jgi:hypothetical protein